MRIDENDIPAGNMAPIDEVAKIVAAVRRDRGGVQLDTAAMLLVVAKALVRDNREDSASLSRHLLAVARELEPVVLPPLRLDS